MLKLEDINFIVVDVETTGSNNRIDRIIDVACVVVKNFEVVSEFSSLINPNKEIPALITDITGIHQFMVNSAPVFSKIIPFIEELLFLENAVFTAHFAKFDYYFIREEFIRAGKPGFDIPALDTLKLAQKILPDEKKKNVASLANYFDVPMMNRHRALGDAKATAYTLIEFLKIMRDDYLVEDFDELMAFQNNVTYVSKSRKEKAELLRENIDKLPQSPGIYKFFDCTGRIIYVGKAKNIKKRVSSYFQLSRVHSKKIAKLVSIVHSIEHLTTVSELSALIVEHNLIRTLNPEYNTAQKKPKLFPFIEITNEDFPRILKTNLIQNNGSQYIGPFSSTYAIDYLFHYIGKKFLYRKCEGELKPNKHCLEYQIHRCSAPCMQNITNEEYLKEIDKLKTYIFEQAVKDLKNTANSFENRKETELTILLERLISDLIRIKSESKTSLYDKNYIILFNDDSNKIILLIKNGLLAQELHYDDELSFNIFFSSLSKLFFSSNTSKKKYSREEVEECVIINNWLRANKNNITIYNLPTKEKLKDFINKHFEFTNSLFN